MDSLDFWLLVDWWGQWSVLYKIKLLGMGLEQSHIMINLNLPALFFRHAPFVLLCKYDVNDKLCCQRLFATDDVLKDI